VNLLRSVPGRRRFVREAARLGVVVAGRHARDAGWRPVVDVGGSGAAGLFRRRGVVLK
jgi:hypothetical protein